MAATKTKKDKKGLLIAGAAAAGIGALILLSKGSGSTVSAGGAAADIGTASIGGSTPVYIPTSDGGAVDTPVGYKGTDINSLLEGINNLNAEQTQRQADLMAQYYNAANPSASTPTGQQTAAGTVRPQQAGSAADELADRVSNPGGSATKLTDLERDLIGYDLTANSLNALFDLEGQASFTGEGLYQLVQTGKGIVQSGGLSNVYQKTGISAIVSRIKTGGSGVSNAPTKATDVKTVTTGNKMSVYSSSGTKIGTIGGSVNDNPVAAYKAEMNALTGGTYQSQNVAAAQSTSRPSTVVTQGGNTTSYTPTTKTTTASNPLDAIGKSVSDFATTVVNVANPLVGAVSSAVQGFFK